jgi:hypothetical protein
MNLEPNDSLVDVARVVKEDETGAEAAGESEPEPAADE